jgi:hypothetical protein
MFGAGPPVALLSVDPAVDQQIPHCKADTLEHLPWRESVPGLRKRGSSVALERRSQRRN